MKKFNWKNIVLAGSLVLVANPIFAAGLDKVNTLMQTIETALRGISVVTVTCAVLWVGYKVVFGGAAFREVAPILVGGVLIGAAAEIAKMLVGSS